MKLKLPRFLKLLGQSWTNLMQPFLDLIVTPRGHGACEKPPEGRHGGSHHLARTPCIDHLSQQETSHIYR
eukprot:2966500-Prorocentrum_lima.AAC.1